MADQTIALTIIPCSPCTIAFQSDSIAVETNRLIGQRKQRSAIRAIIGCGLLGRAKIGGLCRFCCKAINRAQAAGKSAAASTYSVENACFRACPPQMWC